MKIAILFDCFGPYHLARLRAASGACNLLAIQAANVSPVYPWESAKILPPFQQVTLDDIPGSAHPLSRTWLWPCALARRLRRLATALDRFEPDCVFVPGWSNAVALRALWWCRRTGVPAVMMSESTFHDAPRYRVKEGVKSFILRRCAAALVGGSSHAEYIARLGMCRERIFQGYDAVDNDYFRRNAESVRARAVELRGRYALPSRFFLASARFIPRKNLCGLLEAYAIYRMAARASVKKAQGAAAPWSLVLLGDGPERPHLVRKRRELGLDGCVQFPGFVQYAGLPIYYALASTFVLPSFSEPWGLVVNEAMASALPVLVSNRCGCAGDLLREGLNGFAFDPARPEQLAGLMLRMMESESETARMGLAGACRIREWGLDRFCHAALSAARVALALRKAPRRERTAQVQSSGAL